MDDGFDILARFGIEQLPTEDKDSILFDQLADRIAYLMQFEMESMMSMLYRLDVSESKIKNALSPENKIAPNIAIAHLIVERQQERVRTKMKYQSRPLEGWADFE